MGLSPVLASTDRHPELTLDIRQRTLQALEYVQTPAEAAEQILVEEKLGKWDPLSAQQAQDWLRWYQQQPAYDRADYLALTLGHDWSVHRHNTFWLDRAQYFRQSGRLHDAERALRRLRPSGDTEMATARQSLLGLMLVQQARYSEALSELEHRQGFPRTSLYDHYNFGVALVSQGRSAEGMALLDELGQTRAEPGSEHRALLDRANLAVGWSWLAQQQGGTARAFFKRVSLEGPHTAIALLGLGWAQLAPDGQPQEARFSRELYCEDLKDPPASVSVQLTGPGHLCKPGEKASTFKYHHRFAYEPGSLGSERLRKALRYWQELVQSPMHEPAAQEGALAAAFAYRQLGELPRAEQTYRQAIRRMEQEAKRLASLMATVQDKATKTSELLLIQSNAPDFRQSRADVRGQSIRFHLASLQTLSQSLESSRMHMNRYQPSDLMKEKQLEELQQKLQRLAEETTALQESLDSQLRQMIENELDEHQKRLQHYLSRAVLGLALLYDERGRSGAPAQVN